MAYDSRKTLRPAPMTAPTPISELEDSSMYENLLNNYLGNNSSNLQQEAPIPEAGPSPMEQELPEAKSAINIEELMNNWNSMLGSKQPAQQDIPLPNPNDYAAPDSGNANSMEELMANWNKYLGSKKPSKANTLLPNPNLPNGGEIQSAPIEEAALEQQAVPSMEQPQEMPAPQMQAPAAAAQSPSSYQKIMDEYTKHLADSESQLTAANEAKRNGSLFTGLMNSVSQLGTGLANRGNSGFKADKYEEAADPTTHVKELIALRSKKFDKMAEFKKQGREDDLYDPNSEQSRSIRNMVKTSFPEIAAQYPDFEKMSAASFDDVFKVMNLSETQKARIASAEALSGQRQELQKEKNEFKEKEIINKDTQRLSDRLTKSGLPKMTENIQILEDRLGMSIEDMLAKKNKDLPGYGRAASVLPDIMAGDDGRALRQSVQDILNSEISKQYGATQSFGEVARFQKAIGSGNFESEDAILRGLLAIKNGARADMKNIVGGFDQRVKSEYNDRGGIPLDSLGEEQKKKPLANSSDSNYVLVLPPGSSTPKRIPKDKLESALAAGGKLVE